MSGLPCSAAQVVNINQFTIDANVFAAQMHAMCGNRQRKFNIVIDYQLRSRLYSEISQGTGLFACKASVGDLVSILQQAYAARERFAHLGC